MGLAQKPLSRRYTTDAGVSGSMNAAVPNRGLGLAALKSHGLRVTQAVMLSRSHA